MAKVVQFDAVGGPETLTLRDVPVAGLGPSQIRINVKAIGINRAEALFRSGAYFEPPAFPATNE